MIRAAVLLSLFVAPAFGQSTSPGKFILEIGERSVGKADYTFQPSSSGWKLDAHYEFNVPVNVSAVRQAAFRADWEQVSDATNLDVAETKQSFTVSPNKNRSSLEFQASAGGQTAQNELPLQPHTAVLANFDPSGLQVLLNMQAAAPAAAGKYQCFIPSGRGTMLACTLAAAEKAGGTLAGKPLELRHWSLSLAGNIMDLYADSAGNLMDAEVKSQKLDYRRNGFALSAGAQSAAAPPAGVKERDISFPTDGLTAPGTLTMPDAKLARKAEKVGPPIAVLVQGSGVQDRDETVGENKVFQQLAWGLAQRGIATLRFDRRPSFALQSFQQHNDLDHEVVIDAAAALLFCAGLQGVNPAQVFLIGHSLGAQLAPYIVERANAAHPHLVRGLVMLAAIETPIDATLLRQVSDFGKAQGEPEVDIQASLKNWNAVFSDAKDAAVPAAKPEIGGTTAGYWRDWLTRDPAAVMKHLNVPALVLRGDLDANVTHQDFLALAAAATAPGSKAMEFPGLNHLFMPASSLYGGESRAGSIAPVVLDTIQDWIAGLPSGRN